MATELEIWQELADTTDLGWPEWKEGDWQFCLIKPLAGARWSVRWRWTEHETWKFSHCLTDHEAARLFEGHARPFLDAKGLAVRPDDVFYHGGYATALQAAVRAVGKKN